MTTTPSIHRQHLQSSTKIWGRTLYENLVCFGAGAVLVFLHGMNEEHRVKVEATNRVQRAIEIARTAQESARVDADARVASAFENAMLLYRQALAMLNAAAEAGAAQGQDSLPEHEQNSAPTNPFAPKPPVNM